MWYGHCGAFQGQNEHDATQEATRVGEPKEPPRSTMTEAARGTPKTKDSAPSHPPRGSQDGLCWLGSPVNIKIAGDPPRAVRSACHLRFA